LFYIECNTGEYILEPTDEYIRNQSEANSDLPGFGGTVEVYGEGDVEQGYRYDDGGADRQPSLEV